MVCYHPIKLFDNGKHPSGKFKYTTYRTESTVGIMPTVVPCGKCIGCRMEKSRQWAVRCCHELRYHKEACFLTLTYNSENIPDDYGLNKAHMTCFLKRLRKHHPNVTIKYLQCGEYGSAKSRPHHHIILYGLNFKSDRKLYKKTSQNNILYTSETLTKIWGQGFALIGEVTLQSVQYVCRYTLKKKYGDEAKTHYGKRTPEYITASNRPAIGRKFFEQYQTDMYPHDYISFNGRKTKIPKYYDRLLQNVNEKLYELIKISRRKKALENAHLNTPEQLKLREQVLYERMKKLRRGLELQI